MLEDIEELWDTFKRKTLEAAHWSIEERLRPMTRVASMYDTAK